MKVYIFLVFVMYSICFQACNTSLRDLELNLKWVNCQVLCVYWTDLAEKKFKTTAIIFKLKSDSYLNTANYDFYFEDYLITNKSLKLRKNTMQKKEDSYTLNLDLDNEFLKPFLKKDDFSKGAPCYEDLLSSLIQSGKLIVLKKNQKYVVEKSDDFIIHTGVK